MQQKPLCDTCEENILDRFVQGHRYVEKPTCALGRPIYPNAHKCAYFFGKLSDEERAA